MRMQQHRARRGATTARVGRSVVALVVGGLLAGAGCAAGRRNGDEAMPAGWSHADVPSQAGRTYLVTGGTSGIGFETAKALASAGAHVIIAARGRAGGEEALARIKAQVPTARVDFEPLDLGDLASVRSLGARLAATLTKLDGLVNNAGIMEPPTRGTSRDGFELQFAVNYLGHFALTAQVLPLLEQASAPRVVTLSSIAASRGVIRFEDLQFAQAYDAGAAYAQSKLACLMFALELQRRSEAAGWRLQSFASHPGLSRTNLLDHHSALRRGLRFALFQGADRGALPTLFAATAPGARAGRYYGPSGWMEARGAVGLASVPAAASDRAVAAKLWTLSEVLSQTRYPTGTPTIAPPAVRP